MNLYNFLNSFFSYIIFLKVKSATLFKKKTYFVYIFDHCSQMPIKWFVLLIRFVTYTEENYFQLSKCIEREVKWKTWHISKTTTNQTSFQLCHGPNSFIRYNLNKEILFTNRPRFIFAHSPSLSGVNLRLSEFQYLKLYVFKHTSGRIQDWAKLFQDWQK